MLDSIIEKLKTLKDDTSDRHNITEDILRAIADFIEKGLDETIERLTDIANGIQVMEEEIGELKGRIEELEEEE